MREVAAKLQRETVASGPVGSASVGGPSALVDRLPGLLNDIRRSAGEITMQHRLGRLLERLAPLLPVRPEASTVADRLKSLLPALSVTLAQGRSGSGSINPWTVAGTKRREVRNAAILAALWSPAQTGDVAARFLAEFFARCGVRRGQELPTLEQLTLGYRLRVENCPGADGADRVDLVVETATQFIGIEVKIDAGEGRDQLERYVEAIRRSAGQMDKSPRVIFLAPAPPSHVDVVPATWSTVRAAAAAVVPRNRANLEFAHHLIAQFARHARSF